MVNADTSGRSVPRIQPMVEITTVKNLKTIHRDLVSNRSRSHRDEVEVKQVEDVFDNSH